ncbi:phage tail assembly chaperone GT [Mammaliicoccus sciuri]|nr:hypothetical protein [Mammaliicoccus sciuri]
MTKNGEQSINDVLELPFNFVMDELSQDTKSVERKESMLDAFT